ncbi:TIM barrel protein [Desulfovibrio aminophilus]|uniref:sugar phosphate isomerase/epimerase family protein n=1 Tax=Desulfovibrio aminophilus TaxID=81425 RepID=UPI003394F785
MSDLRDRVQVNARFFHLAEGLLDRFLDEGLNPEIGLFAKDLDEYGPDQFREAEKALRDRGLRPTVHGPFVDLSPGSPDPLVLAATRRRFEQLVEAVEILRPRSVTCHLGFEHSRHGYFKEFWLEQSLMTWRWLARELRDRGARLMLENTFERAPEEMLPALNELSSLGVGLCLDVGHLNLFSAAKVAQWVEEAGPCLGQLHLHDNFGHRDDHLPIGQGRIDYPAVFRNLAYLPEPLTVTMEVGIEGAPLSFAALEQLWPW